MEPDRFKHHELYYLVGILCLIISIGLFAFSFYLIPFLAFDWYHGVPEFIIWISGNLRDDYQLSRAAASWLIFVSIFFSGVIFAVIADIISMRIDNDIYGITPAAKVRVPTSERSLGDRTEARMLIFKIIFIMILLFVAARFFQWVIST